MDKKISIYEILDSKINREPIFQNDIDKLQKDYNIKLPQDYIDFFLKTNGGVIEAYIEINKEDYLTYNKLLYDLFEIIEIGEFYDLNLILYFLEDKEDSPEYQELLDINLFPIASDGSYAHEFFIGVGENNFGKIYFYERFMLEVNDKYIHYVCDSFTEFIENFYLRKQID